MEAPLSSISLLVYSCRDTDRANALLDSVAGLFDEVHVVDSSPPAEYERFRARRTGSVAFHRVLPVGYVDLLRPYGLAQVRTDRVLVLDTDERLSEGLRAALPTLTGADGYVLPRHEVSLGAYTYHLRLFRPGRARYPAETWGFPAVRGPTATLDRSCALLHLADHGDYLARDDRAGRYLWVESIERPFTLGSGRAGAGTPLAWGRASGSNPEPEVLARLTEWWAAARTLLRSGRPALARFQRQYDRRRREYFYHLPAEEQAQRIRLRDEIRGAGGLVAYLGFDRPPYVDALTSEFGWDREGPEVLRRLIAYRLREGHPLPAAEWSERLGDPVELR